MKFYFVLLACFVIIDSLNASAFPWLDEGNSNESDERTTARATTTRQMKKQRKNGKKFREQQVGRPYYGWREVPPLPPLQQDWYNNQPVQLSTEILGQNQWLLPTTSSITQNNWWDNQNKNWWENQQNNNNNNNNNNNWWNNVNNIQNVPNTNTQAPSVEIKATTKWDEHPLNNYNPDDWNSNQQQNGDWNNWSNNWAQPQPQPTNAPLVPQPPQPPKPPVAIIPVAPIIPQQVVPLPQPTVEQPKPPTPAPVAQQPAGPPGTYDHIIDDNCMKCLCFIESWCSDVGCVMDQGSLSCGWYQLKYEYWLDCGAPGGDWKTCANNKKCAEGCVRKYINRYGQFCTEPGVQPRCQDLVRIHNGGPYGCRSNHTEYYGWYVSRCLIRQPPYENIDSQKIPEK